MNGEIPEGLHPLDPITPHDVFKVAFWHETEVSRPSYDIVDGLVVLGAEGEKRKRTYKRAKERQEMKKRQRLEENKNKDDDNTSEEENTGAVPAWPMQFNHMPVNPMQGAPALPQLRLDHGAFLAPPERAMQHQVPPVQMPQEQDIMPQDAPEADEQPELATVMFCFAGTLEQIQLFQAGCVKWGKLVAELTGAQFFPQESELDPVHTGTNLVQGGFMNTQNEQQPQMPIEEDQLPPEIISQLYEDAQIVEEEDELESPFFIDGSDLNLMDLDENGPL
jgi:hypothetical protein